MTHIELPRALEHYFAFAEIEPTRHGRRFTITLPYFQGPKLDRLQWWYHVSPNQEQQHGAAIVQTLRAQATQRFRQHIERWLQNTGQKLFGAEPIPSIGPVVAHVYMEAVAASPAASASTGTPPEEAFTITSWPTDRVANG